MSDVYSVPISRRPSSSWTSYLYGFIFAIVFDFGCFMINGTQFLCLLPLKLFASASVRALYDDGIRYTKGAFGCLMILMVQWFSPTRFLVTFEREGLGRFTEDEIEKIVVRDETGNVVYLDLPEKFVMVANHQIYADWWYAWCFMYFIGPHGVHRDVYITLKKSLQWIPVIGWGMQFFRFIFLKRSWASDRVQLASALSSLARSTAKRGEPLSFFLYPEGTLVSQHTRPISKKYADKMGIDDMVHTLLPRSTGLHYSLRALAPRIPNLRLLSITMVYPGIPPLGYGQDYYTLRSIFLNGVPPPSIHMHLRIFDVTQDVPLGKSISAANANIIPDPQKSHEVIEVDIPDNEKVEFDEFLRSLWREKDRSIETFLNQRTFSESHSGKVDAEIPIRLKRSREILDAFCFFIPALIGYLPTFSRR